MTPEARRSLLQSIPKIELHVHLEGSIPPTTLLELARRNGVDLPARSPDEVSRWYRFRDFPHFSEVYGICSRCIRSPRDIEDLLYGFLESQARQNIIYTEVTFTALTHFRNYRIPLDDQLSALDAARLRGERELGVYCGIIADMPREWATREQSMLIADWVAANHGDTLLAFGLGGYEVGYPPGIFREAFARAAARGVPAVIHGGETGGPENIAGALDDLHALRIGHGVRCFEDPALVERLKQEQTPLEVCISSNVCLGVFADLDSHPLGRMVSEGLNVSLNTDDPPMFGTDLVGEYELALDRLGLSLEDLAASLQRAVVACLAPAPVRHLVARRIAEAAATLRGV